jgi:hypothetical protein
VLQLKFGPNVVAGLLHSSRLVRHELGGTARDCAQAVGPRSSALDGGRCARQIEREGFAPVRSPERLVLIMQVAEQPRRQVQVVNRRPVGPHDIIIVGGGSARPCRIMRVGWISGESRESCLVSLSRRSRRTSGVRRWQARRRWLRRTGRGCLRLGIRCSEAPVQFSSSGCGGRGSSGKGEFRPSWLSCLPQRRVARLLPGDAGITSRAAPVTLTDWG